MEFDIRTERPQDRTAAEALTRDAFFNVHVPGCCEHYILHVMRDCDAFVPELALCAWHGDELVGCAYQTLAVIVDDGGGHHPVLCLGPIGVLPGWQKKGVGAALIREGQRRARELGYAAIALYGDPAYYGRNGFEPAERFGVRTPDDMYADALQICVLRPDALAGVNVRFFEDSVFEVDEAAVAAFDSAFPAKEKQSGLPSQKRFLETVAMRRPAKA